jgi:hypothetical protein
MFWDDSVVTSSIACQFQNFSGQVFHDGSQVHRGTSSNTFSIVVFAQQAMDTTDWEPQSSTNFALFFTFPPLPRPDILLIDLCVNDVFTIRNSIWN